MNAKKFEDYQLMSVGIERERGGFYALISVYRLANIKFSACGKGSLAALKSQVSEMLKDVYGMTDLEINPLLALGYKTCDGVFLPQLKPTAREVLLTYQQGGLTLESLQGRYHRNHMWASWVSFATAYGYELKEIKAQDDGEDCDCDLEPLRQAFESGYGNRDTRDESVRELASTQGEE